ncbi:class I SAM-dependent methyltransferase [Patescibacteria group bacterium]|nr:class I SAM-dependent methyltransferase [Patescibacteria group bacterium]
MVHFSGKSQLIDAEKIFQHLDLEEGQKIADLGCGGTGHFTIPAARLVGKNGMVYAVDILRSLLKENARRARMSGVNNIKTIWSNLEIYGATKIPANNLDVAMLINTMFHSKQHDAIMKEAMRLTKKNGRILVCDWKKAASPIGPPTIDRVAPQEIKIIAKSLDLKLIEEFSAGKYHYGLIFIK